MAAANLGFAGPGSAFCLLPDTTQQRDLSLRGEWVKENNPKGPRSQQEERDAEHTE